MEHKFFAQRRRQKVGPFPTREEALDAFRTAFPHKGKAYTVSAVAAKITTGYGSDAPSFDIRWHDAEERALFDLVVYSKFGLHCNVEPHELRAHTVVDATASQIAADIAEKGFCLTWCDVEPVAVMPYPEDREPEAVLMHLTGSPDGSDD